MKKQNRSKHTTNNSSITTTNTKSDYTIPPPSILIPPPSPTNIGCCAPLKLKSPCHPTSDMYFESRGKCCKKLLRYNGYPNKVLLYPEESWARSAASSYLILTPCRWRRNTCIVEEVAGSRK
uniref:CSON006572 protein n=1 Tax=Culicoides sonorensis TaxID=179676 RepID=A0A336MSV1_CULSO